MEATGPGGADVPDGFFRLGTDRLTVPAGGKAEVTVTVDTRLDGPDGHWTGRVVARAGEVVVQTPVAVNKEVETYELTVDLVNLDLGGDAYSRLTVFGLDEPLSQGAPTADGVARIRLPKGRYALQGYFVAETADATRRESAMMVMPELTVDTHRRVTIDANRSAAVRMTVPQRGAIGVLATVETNFIGDGGSFGYGAGLIGDTYEGMRVGQVGPAVSADVFVASFTAQWAGPEVTNSQYLYATVEAVPGRMPTGLVRHYQRREFATVKQEFAALGGGLLAERGVYGEFDADFLGWGVLLPVAAPGKRVEYYKAAGLRWSSSLDYGTPVEDLPWLDLKAMLSQDNLEYRAGRQYRDRWGGAPLSQSFAESQWGPAGLFRTSDIITLDVPVYSDTAGHPGSSLTDTARTALYRDGVLVGESADPGYGAFEVPAAAGRYRMETSATRSFTDLEHRSLHRLELPLRPGAR